MANTNELSAIMRDLTVDTDQSAANARTAAAKVGSTPELLERVLSHLPVLDLVMATGVSKTFRNVIQTSPQLQQKLFMSPSTNEAEYWHIVKHVYNTIHLQRMEPPGIVDAGLKAHLDAVAANPNVWQLRTRYLKVVSICPLVGLFTEARKSPSNLGLSSMNGAFEVQLRIKPRGLRAIEPWTNMFITDSPCKDVMMSLVWEGRVAGKTEVKMEAWRRVRCEQGFTLALLVDSVAKKPGLITI